MMTHDEWEQSLPAAQPSLFADALLPALTLVEALGAISAHGWQQVAPAAEGLYTFRKGDREMICNADGLMAWAAALDGEGQ